jgi:hypothetical protein
MGESTPNLVTLPLHYFRCKTNDAVCFVFLLTKNSYIVNMLCQCTVFFSPKHLYVYVVNVPSAEKRHN